MGGVFSLVLNTLFEKSLYNVFWLLKTIILYANLELLFIFCMKVYFLYEIIH